MHHQKVRFKGTTDMLEEIKRTVTLFPGEKMGQICSGISKEYVGFGANVLKNRFDALLHRIQVPFEGISPRCNARVIPFQQFQEGPLEVLLR